MKYSVSTLSEDLFFLQRRSSASISVLTTVLLLLLILPVTSAFAQTGRISGTVTNPAGEPLQGVNVVIEGTTQGASTDIDGQYIITDVGAGTYTLRASFVGYTTETEVGVQVQEGEVTMVDFALQPQAVDLEEVVAVGYGERTQQDLTGSISSFEAAEINEANTTSIDQALQGRIPGVRVVQTSGKPGAVPIVRIRGRNSILGNNQPLYVVDGVPIGRGGEGGGKSNPLSTLNPGDIESVDVLKDASATAIYGARGSNGVIVITTKRGEREGQRRVSFNASVGASNMEGVEALNTSQYVELMRDRAANGGLPDPFPNGVPEDAADTDWLDVVSQNGITQEYNLSMSGGDESGSYRISGNYLNEEGVVRNSSLERASIRANIREEVGNLSVSTQLNLSRVVEDERGDDGGIIGNTFDAIPLVPPRQPDGTFTSVQKLRGFPFVLNSVSNPLADAELGLNGTIQNRVLGNVTLDYQLTGNINVQFRGGGDIAFDKGDFFSPISPATGSGTNSGSETRSEDRRWLAEGKLTFDRTIAEKHNLNVDAVANLEEQEFSFLSGSASNFVSGALRNNNLSAGEDARPPRNRKSESTLISYVGRIDYGFTNRYLATLTGRVDGSSVFGEVNKWGFFPSGALAWRASEEDFIQNVDQISNLKLRFSWGVSGNDAIAPYQTLPSFFSTNVAFNRVRQVGLIPGGLPSPDLKWESTEQYNVGLDVGLFNQRYTFGVDLYNKITSDLLANVPLPGSSGFSSTLRNIGKIRNRGVEFQFGAEVLTGEVGLSLDGNISANRNKVLNLARGSDILSAASSMGSQSIAREGEPIGSFFGRELADPRLTENGRFNYVDQNGDGNLDDRDNVIVGDPYPTFTYGLNIDFRYEGFSVSSFLQGVQGKEIYSIAKQEIGSGGQRGRNQIEKVFNNRWTRENQNRNAEYPAAIPNLNRAAGEFAVENGSYLRIQTVRIGYNLPADRLDLPFESANVFVSGKNIVTITPYDFFSPDLRSESGNSLNIGVHNFRTYPLSRTITFGTNISF